MAEPKAFFFAATADFPKGAFSEFRSAQLVDALAPNDDKMHQIQ
jgi:hypothetical protein